MRYELAKLKAQLKTTMIYVTHDQSEAVTLADKIVVMRDGSIEQVGSPMELYNSPVNTFVAKFIGSSEMNILPVFFVNNVGRLSVFRLPDGQQVSLRAPKDMAYCEDKQYYLGVRPEDMEILQNEALFFGNKLEGSISLSENLGGEGLTHVTLKDGLPLTIKSKKNTVERVGSNVKCGFNINSCYLFDENKNSIHGVDDNPGSDAHKEALE
jgi:ABC-type sugar transport system ATPase subunit